MATARQIEANRLNAQNSTGPRTEEGKARSRFNALKSGIDADSILLPGEAPGALESLRAEYYSHHQPITPEERDTLDAVIHAVWLLRRLRRLEPQLFAHELAAIPAPDGSSPLGHVFSQSSQKFVHLQSRLNSAERSFHRNFERLGRLESQRPPAETPPQPSESVPETTKLASFPDPPRGPSAPQHHPADYTRCPHCRKVGFADPGCRYLLKQHGEPRPGHPARLDDCPQCRNLGYISPNCPYILKEPRE